MWDDGLPPLTSLRAFDAAARHLGFSAAGRELNVTHAAVSQQVRRLEAELGLTLVERHGRGLRLTEAGGRLAAGLEQGFAGLRAAVEAVRREARRRPLRVTMTHSFAVTWLMPRLGAFRAAHPEVELMLHPSAESVDLARDGFDLAIRYGRGGWAGLECEPLVRSRFVVVAEAGLLAGRAIGEAGDLLDLPWLQELGTEELQLWLASRGVAVGEKQDVLHLPGHMVLQALREGQGVACMSRVLVEAELESGRLVVLFEDEDDGDTGYYLVRRPGPVREALQVFIDWLRASARQDVADMASAGPARVTGGTVLR